jgi:hypothetical protein
MFLGIYLPFLELLLAVISQAAGFPKERVLNWQMLAMGFRSRVLKARLKISKI